MLTAVQEDAPGGIRHVLHIEPPRCCVSGNTTSILSGAESKGGYLEGGGGDGWGLTGKGNAKSDTLCSLFLENYEGNMHSCFIRLGEIRDNFDYKKGRLYLNIQLAEKSAWYSPSRQKCMNLYFSVSNT